MTEDPRPGPAPVPAAPSTPSTPAAPVADPARRHYAETAEPVEIALPRGDVTEGVVRVGDTVRRPHQPQSLAVAGYLDHLERAGFSAAPRFLGRDLAGRDVLSYLEGEAAADPPQGWAAADALLASVAVLLRQLHDASQGYLADTAFAAPGGSTWAREQVLVHLPTADPVPELVSHNDVTPQNVVVRDGVAVGLVDFDLAGPTTRLLDVLNTAMWWVPLRPSADLWPAWTGVDQPRRLRAFADAYALPLAGREALIDLGIRRADASWLRMRAAAHQLGGGWARMWDEGAGEAIRRRQGWLIAAREELRAALLG